MNNLMRAARPLANDFLSTIVFVVLVAMKVDARIATACAIAFGVGHVLYMRARRLPVAPLQWAGLALVLVFGTASLMLNDIRFLMAKPTIIYLIIAAVMLKRGWMLRYMPPIARGRSEGLMVVFGYVWAGLMMLTAAANLIMATAFTAQWPLFMAVFPMASKIVLFAVQFLTVRAYVRPRQIAEMAARA